MSQTHHFRQAVDLLWSCRFLAEEQRQSDVVENAQPGNQIELLKDKPDFVPAQLDQFGFRQTRGVNTVDDDFAAGRLIETAEDMQQGCFTGPGRASNGNKFFFVNTQVNPA
jgi:hypothetical protein